MKISLSDFSFSQNIVVSYCRLNDCLLSACSFDQVRLYAQENGYDIDNPSNYCLNFLNIIPNGKKRNGFYFKAIEYFKDKLGLKEDFDESTLYCVFIPFFKNPNKYIFENEFVFSVKDIHRQLFLMQKFKIYSKDLKVDTLINQLNDQYGIPFLTKEDLQQFAKELQVV